MIDIHSHILPGLDDGAQTEEDALEMAREAVNDGIEAIVATPHHLNRTYENKRDEILKAVDFFRDLLEYHKIPLHVLPGQELRINGDILLDYDRKELLPLNDTKYLLIEFASDTVPHYTPQLFYDIQHMGIKPVIAHPERNRTFLRDPYTLYNLVRQGALTQVTAASVIGKFGKTIESFTHNLIEANQVHFIASDAHNVTTRGFCMKETTAFIRKKFGPNVAHMFYENGHLLIENENVNKFEPLPIEQKKKKRFFGLF